MGSNIQRYKAISNRIIINDKELKGLDFFNSMHAHLIDEHGYDRMELGESVDSHSNIQRYKAISNRIIINDKELKGLDPHGQNVLDLDNDGILDIMIASGGAKGTWK